MVIKLIVMIGVEKMRIDVFKKIWIILEIMNYKYYVLKVVKLYRFE